LWRSGELTSRNWAGQEEPYRRSMQRSRRGSLHFIMLRHRRLEMAQLVATTKTAAHKAKVMEPAAAPVSSVESQAARMPAPADREQAIREAAYALFEARGCEPGHELDDWLEAEAQVLQMESTSAGGTEQLAH
jgi:Protein of unknown function (DUF2934)